MIKIFENTRPITILSSLFWVLIITLFGIYKYFINETFKAEFLIQSYYPNMGDGLASLISVIIMLSLAILLHNIVHEHSITRDNSFALLFFVILISTNHSIVILNPVLIATLFIVIALKYLLSLHEHKKMTQKLFNAGLLIGIASVFYPFAIFYGLLIYLGVTIYGADSWRQWLLPLIGIALPFYFLFTGYYIFDSLDVFWDKYFIQAIEFTKHDFFKSTGQVILWGIFIGITIFATLDYTGHMRSQKLDTKKGYSMNYLSLLIGIFIVALGEINNGQEFIILFFPTSIIWAKYMQHKKNNRWKNLFFLFVLLNSIYSIVLNNL